MISWVQNRAIDQKDCCELVRKRQRSNCLFLDFFLHFFYQEKKWNKASNKYLKIICIAEEGKTVADILQMILIESNGENIITMGLMI